MQIIGLVAAIALWVYGFISYARCVKVHDVMGASFSFTLCWTMGSFAMALALNGILALATWTTLGILVALVLLGKPIELFVLDRLLKPPRDTPQK